jgi:hypothetical protein
MNTVNTVNTMNTQELLKQNPYILFTILFFVIMIHIFISYLFKLIWNSFMSNDVFLLNEKNKLRNLSTWDVVKFTFLVRLFRVLCGI